MKTSRRLRQQLFGVAFIQFFLLMLIWLTPFALAADATTGNVTTQTDSSSHTLSQEEISALIQQRITQYHLQQPNVTTTTPQPATTPTLSTPVVYSEPPSLPPNNNDQPALVSPVPNTTSVSQPDTPVGHTDNSATNNNLMISEQDTTPVNSDNQTNEEESPKNIPVVVSEVPIKPQHKSTHSYTNLRKVFLRSLAVVLGIIILQQAVRSISAKKGRLTNRSEELQVEAAIAPIDETVAENPLAHIWAPYGSLLSNKLVPPLKLISPGHEEVKTSHFFINDVPQRRGIIKAPTYSTARSFVPEPRSRTIYF